MLGELMTVNDTMFFEYFKLPGNKKVDSGKERGRKEGGRRFYLVLEKVVKGSDFVKGKGSSIKAGEFL